MSEIAKRKRGRPAGSRNKSKIISGATVEDYCKRFNHNPTEFLIRVGRGETVSGFVPTHEDQFRANTKLHDGIHHNRPVGSIPNGSAIDGQYEIVFEEGPSGFELPGAPNAAGGEGVMREQPVQRLGHTSPGGEDRICDQQTDS